MLSKTVELMPWSSGELKGKSLRSLFVCANEVNRNVKKSGIAKKNILKPFMK